MKKLPLLFCLLLTAATSFANKIDELKTDSDVVRFLLPLDKHFTTGKYTPKLIIEPVDTIFKNDACFACDTLCKTWGVKSWQKVDLNNDGRTDLVAICHWYQYENFIVMDNGDGTFKLMYLVYDSWFCELVNIIRRNDQNLIVFHTIDSDMLDRFEQPRTDTLIYKYDHFVELNEHPPKYAIDSLIFYDGSVYGNHCGSCPKFRMKVNRKGKTRYERYVYGGTSVKTAGGYSVKDFKISTELKAQGKVLSSQQKEILNMINYINFKKLKDKYEVPWTDASTTTIQVKFKDGSSKTIVDYGEYGTFGLRALFSKLYAVAKPYKAF
ncbi:DUF6438 domain-containing protein [Mucilaginibacter sp. dw_454]|uniref:DUF6438 domain-containing protein n=1 Tax=Mucilaginibacter sp. dw_454 TaxID=2720079 RepID=UPI001BD522A2|nr:DUF6438 domain-containing protein [Mucilaginibacter sp. dw_454]